MDNPPPTLCVQEEQTNTKQLKGLQSAGSARLLPSYGKHLQMLSRLGWSGRKVIYLYILWQLNN